MYRYADDAPACPRCGFVEGTMPENAMHLRPGTKLNYRYIVGNVLGFGGFGVTYSGWDALEGRPVAIKEYLPGEFATRTVGQTEVVVYSGTKQVQFVDGMTGFLGDAKKLSEYNNTDGIVKIYDSFEFNNTAYIVMELLEGETLAKKLERGETFSENEVVGLLIPVIKSLEKVHKDGIIHRDISPENIFITTDGVAKLIDFGSARYATMTHSRSLTSVIRTGYAPEEQYRSQSDQGVYTDVYALAATMYKMITGEIPPDAMQRRAYFETKNKDTLVPLSRFRKNIDPNKEKAIMNALNVRIEDRTPDMETFLFELTSDEVIDRRAGRIQKNDIRKLPLWAKIAVPSLIGLIIIFGILLAFGIIHFDKDSDDSVILPEGYTRVPNVVGKEYHQGEEIILKNLLLVEVGGKEHFEDIPENSILNQSIDFGSIVPENSIVSVKVNSQKLLQQVPYALGMDQKEAKTRLEAAGFSVTVKEEYSSVIAENCVISQSVKPFGETEFNSEIELTVSKGEDPSEAISDFKTESMKKLKGMSYDRVLTLAEKNGFKVKVTDYEYNKEKGEGIVLEQSVKNGDDYTTGDVVELKVSLGYDKVRIPDLSYYTEEEAKQLLSGRGLKCVIDYTEHDSVKEGLVISHDPTAGSEADPETTVKVTVSLGKKAFPMPNVVGMQQKEAVNILKEKNLAVIVEYEENENKPEDEVLKQSVEAGKNVKSGDEIMITVCTHSDVIEVPDVRGKAKKDAEKLLKDAGFKVNVDEIYNDNYAKGKVSEQAPKGGSKLKKGDTVIIYVSKGSKNGNTSSTGKNTSSTSSKNVSSGTNTDASTNADTETTTQTPGNTETTRSNSSSPDVDTTNSHEEKHVEPEAVSLNKSSLEMFVNDSKMLVANVSPSSAEDKSVTWRSDNEGVATVNSNGWVNGKSSGTATISATTSNGLTASCTVTVKSSTVDPESISLDKTELFMKQGDTDTLNAAVFPENATDKSISWSSNNEIVATVNNGEVHALSYGEATITATTSNGETAECVVTVNRDGSKVKEVGTLSQIRWELYENGNLYILGEGIVSDDFYNKVWNNINDIKTILIGENVESLGNFEFGYFIELDKVRFEGNTDLKDDAFNECHDIIVEYPSSHEQLNEISQKDWSESNVTFEPYDP